MNCFDMRCYDSGLLSLSPGALFLKFNCGGRQVRRKALPSLGRQLLQPIANIHMIDNSHLWSYGCYLYNPATTVNKQC